MVELSTSIDLATVKNKTINHIGDYNIDYLNEKERKSLDTITIPYGLRITNTVFPTRVQGNSMSLIDYIITDLPQVEKFQIVFSDTLLRTLHGKEIDHYAKSLISTITIQQLSKVMIKKVFDKTKQNVQVSPQLINDSNWGNFYNQDCAEGVFTIFIIILERAFKKCTPMKTVFVRNDKSDMTVQQKWVTEETCKIYKQMNYRMNPKDMKNQNLHRDFVEKVSGNFLHSRISSFNNLSKDKDKWNFNKEARNNRLKKTIISCLRSSFGESIADPKRIADLLIYRFSKLGEYFNTA